MRPNNRLRSFLILINFLIVLSAYSEVIGTTKTDSLRNELDKNSGSNKISIQLDLALQIFNYEKDEALILAKSALSASQKIDNSPLEMRSY